MMRDQREERRPRSMVGVMPVILTVRVMQEELLQPARERSFPRSTPA